MSELHSPIVCEERLQLFKRLRNKNAGVLSALTHDALHDPMDSGRRLSIELEKLHNKPLSQMTRDEFFCDELITAFASLADSYIMGIFPQMVELRLEGSFSSVTYRKSYHSHTFGYIAPSMPAFISSILRQSLYTESVLDRLYAYADPLGDLGYEYLLAYAIRQGNEDIIALIHNALVQSDAQLLTFRAVFNAIIISGHKGLVEDLIDLLLAAGIQEGLRQNILSSASIGSVDVLIRFLKACLDHDLFRFSSAIHAFDQWSGLGYNNANPDTIRSYAQCAYNCLIDTRIRETCLTSSNLSEVYFALWAQGCYEIDETFEQTKKLLADPCHHRKILGWMFVSRAGSKQFQMDMASQYLDERDDELLAWITHNLTYSDAIYFKHPVFTMVSTPIPIVPADLSQRQQLFSRLWATAEFIGNRSPVFSGKPFDFVSIQLNVHSLYCCLLSLAGCNMDPELIDMLIDIAPQLPSDYHRTIISRFLQPNIYPNHRQFLLAELNHRSSFVREAALRKMETFSLGNHDISSLIQALRTRSSDLRSKIVSLLCSQDFNLLRPKIREMLTMADTQKQAAVELLLKLKDAHPELLEENASQLTALRQHKVSAQLKILLEQLPNIVISQPDYTPENGFGLYNPDIISTFNAACKISGDIYSFQELIDLLPPKNELFDLITRIGDVFDRHADQEIEFSRADGTICRVKFGDSTAYLPPIYSQPSETFQKPDLSRLPFWNEFLEAAGDYAQNIRKALGAYQNIAINFIRFSNDFHPWFSDIVDKLSYSINDHPIKDNTRRSQISAILVILPWHFDTGILAKEAVKIYRSLLSLIGFDKLHTSFLIDESRESVAIINGQKVNFYIPLNHGLLRNYRKLLVNLTIPDDIFMQWFPLEYWVESKNPAAIRNGLAFADYCRAAHLKLIPMDMLIQLLTCPQNLAFMTQPYKQAQELMTAYPFLSDILHQVVNRVIDVELKRGDMKTPLTASALAIYRHWGIQHFVKLLAALGKDDFQRDADSSRQGTLSKLLKCCYPSSSDTAEKMAAAMKQHGLEDKRMVEAVMLAPQWGGIVEEAIHWPGLKSGVWFFHAHISERFSAEKETEVALLSPISPLQYNDGAFDRNWFLSLEKTLGAERMLHLRHSAKYITESNNAHRRAQIYADAALGKYEIHHLEQEILETRNLDKLRSYSLLPLDKDNIEELLHRYCFIHSFLRDSASFGAQRRASEQKAGQTTLENLAVAVGIMDVNRLTWRMESARLQSLSHLFQPITLEDITVQLTIDEEGTPSIALTKQGKIQKSIPTKIKKDPVYLERKAAVQEFEEQKRRSRESLEQAMIESVYFDVAEMALIWRHPILRPMLEKLVWTTDKACGFLHLANETDVMLKDTEGTNIQLAPNAQLRIAHPYDLKHIGCWSQFMHYAYTQRLLQPFKQIFREYYPITTDEQKDEFSSQRYAGHQVYPKRAAALLKKRGWTVDYEEGFQKVFYQHNMVAHVYAMADWFSPSDIEPPTLETVSFTDRRTGKAISMLNIPPMLFSETMRDLDLAVSVAHAGGVAPEASHSSVAMRLAIARELADLLGLSNVSWEQSHAKVHGRLANYSIHMGSGIIHAEGIGMIDVLPIHSQARGRIFLPFADDDPQTAEIMSKILLFAEDYKIKDSSILSQILA